MNTFRRFLVESPQLLSGSTDFGMGDKPFNRERAKEWLKKKVEDIEESDSRLLFRTGDGVTGYYVLYNKETKLVDYFIKYEHTKISGRGPFVTQVLLWRRMTATFVGASSITKKVFFEILLPKYKRIASDQQQTEEGRDFWIRNMALASNAGHRIGILEKGKEIVYFDKSNSSYDDWIEELELDSWGEHQKYRLVRFIIEE